MLRKFSSFAAFFEWLEFDNTNRMLLTGPPDEGLNGGRGKTNKQGTNIFPNHYYVPKMKQLSW